MIAMLSSDAAQGTEGEARMILRFMTGFDVEVASDLNAGWGRLNAIISTNATLNYTDIPAPVGQKFFRLATP